MLQRNTYIEPMEGNLLLTFFSLGLSGQQTDLSKVIN